MEDHEPGKPSLSRKLKKIDNTNNSKLKEKIMARVPKVRPVRLA